MGGKFAGRARRRKIGGNVKKIRRSRRQGVELQGRWEAHLKARFRFVFKGVDIQGIHIPRSTAPGPSSVYAPKSSGAIPEADFIVGDSLDDLHPVEIKKTPQSGQTNNQRLGYPRVNRDGGLIVVRKPLTNLVTGEVHALEGVEIQPRRFVRLYEVDAVAVEAQQVTTDELFTKRKGQLHPRPTPLQLPPASETGAPPRSRGTSNNGVDESTRSRERPKAGAGTDRAVSARGSAGRQAADATPAFGSAGVAPEPGDHSIRSSSGFLKNLAKGFALEIVKGLVLNALIGPYERQLGEVNLEQTARSFKTFILPKVEPVLHGELAHSYEVLFNPDKHVWPADRRYLLVWWYQFTEEQAANVGDVAVWAYRFPEGFAEVFHSVQINQQGPYGSPFANWHGKGSFKRRAPSRTEIRRDGKN